jgi:hypothetical protein
MNLEGPVSGHTLTLGLDTSTPSTGTVSVDPVGNQFQINSFFNVFADLTLDTTTPLITTRQAQFELASPMIAVPEPASFTLLLGSVFGLAVARRLSRRRVDGRVVA